MFHIRRYPGGLVSTQIGATIRPGHRVQVRGPFGGAFLREGDGPIVLIGGGTGWAPIWSVAAAARREQRHRDLIVIAGSRDAEGLYMRRSLEWLIDDGVREVIATAEIGATDPVLRGRPTHYLPSLGPEDTVYVAGPPPLVDAVKLKSRAAAARCYADPFLPNAQPLSLIDRVMAMLRRPRRARSRRPARVPAPSPIPPAGAGAPEPAAALPPRPAAPRAASRHALTDLRRFVRDRSIMLVGMLYAVTSRRNDFTVESRRCASSAMSVALVTTFIEAPRASSIVALSRSTLDDTLIEPFAAAVMLSAISRVTAS